jgi:hypothetical protein
MCVDTFLSIYRALLQTRKEIKEIFMIYDRVREEREERE